MGSRSCSGFRQGRVVDDGKRHRFNRRSPSYRRQWKSRDRHRAHWNRLHSGAITKYFELQVTDPARLAGKWISLIPSDSGYSNVSASVTLKSDFSQIQLEGPYSKIFESISGQNLIAIHGFTPGPSGSAPVRAVLDVTADGTILPVAFEASDGQLTESVTWSDWGDAVTLLAPQKSLPISEIGS
jgi:hypothetical protein